MSDWRRTWRVSALVKALDRGATEKGIDYSQPVGLADFPAGTYPACRAHGAMLRMTSGDDRPPIYRCDACGAGAESLGSSVGSIVAESEA